MIFRAHTHIFWRVSASVVVLVAALALVGCSTKRNTWFSRGFQRLTSRYNVYYNGVEAFEAGLGNISARTRDDYCQVLPVYEFSDRSAAAVAQGDMETALRKAHKLVQLHSITVKPARRDGPMTDEERRFRAKSEYNAYVPLAYLLMGKANVVIHEEREAIETFDYLSRRHEGEPSAYEGKIWASIAYTQLGLYNNAFATLKSYDIDGVAPAELYAEFQAAYANVYIAQGQYAQAIPYMTRAAAEIRGRHLRHRYAYILAQLHRAVGDKAKAAPIFLSLSRVIGNYDMAFAAKLDLATVASSDEELRQAEKSLRKMARDPKNADNLDQVLYAIGNLEVNKGRRVAAVDAFWRSVRQSAGNDNQKGLSFLALADIYQSDPLYIDASTALDSASAYLSPSNARRDEAVGRAKLLAPLAEQLRIVRDNDSTLALARLADGERNALLDNMARLHNERLDAEQEAREAEMMGAMSQSDFYQVEQGQQRTGQSSWYFYNNQLVTAGKAAFRSRWGARRNEDNWRRADKSSSGLGSVDADEPGDDDRSVLERVRVPASNPQDLGRQRWSREMLLRGLPLTPEAQEANERQTARALLRSAELLYDDLGDYALCARQLEEYLRRFGGSEADYDALTLLYFAKRRAGDAAGASRASADIVARFPQSLMARNLADPSFMQERQAGHESRERHYRDTYAAYLASDFASAERMAAEALADADIEQRPQYMLVRAMANAKLGRADAFRAGLEEITAACPATPQDTLARRLLELLDKGLAPVRHEDYDSPLSHVADLGGEAEAAKVEYVYRPDTVHVVLCVVDKGRQNDALFAVADYNFTNYLLTDYDIAMPTLHGGTPAVVVSAFRDRGEAEVYFYALREQSFWRRLSSDPIPKIFMMSVDNLRLCAMSGIDERFRDFMKTHYGI